LIDGSVYIAVSIDMLLVYRPVLLTTIIRRLNLACLV